MRRGRWLLALALLLVPGVAQAIQLHWSPGADTLTFAAATRAILVLRADSAEVTLPPQWRLLWVADSSEVRIVALDSLEVCAGDTAQVYGVAGPVTPADSTANLVTAHFCSAGGAAAARARYVLDLPAGGRGKCKVVALDPADSTSVLESNEVTFNGGLSDSFPPVILLAGRTHASSELRVEVVGVGLTGEVELAAPDGSWSLALERVGGSSTRLTALGRVAADLPDCELHVGGSLGIISTAPLAADTVSQITYPPCVFTMFELDPTHVERIQPKDFAIVPSRDSVHILYIRRDMNIADPDFNEKTIGHKRSRDLNVWEPYGDTNTWIALEVRPGKWDNFHVWAPTIIRKPNDVTFYMLYTGVDSLSRVQRIGVATSTDLNVWQREDEWVFSHDNVAWACHDTLTDAGRQFRDPFVMMDPDTAGYPGEYVMYYTTIDDSTRRYVVGVARSVGGDLRRWEDLTKLRCTDSLYSSINVVESPHAWVDPAGRWSLYYTGGIGFADNAYVFYQTNDVSPYDPDPTHWSASSGGQDTLWVVQENSQTLQNWHATEYLWCGTGYEYLAAFDDDQQGISMSQIHWTGAHDYELDYYCPLWQPPLAVGDTPAATAAAIRVVGGNPVNRTTAFQVTVPSPMLVRLGIYDVAGRLVRGLLDEEVKGVVRDVQWDGRGQAGVAAPGLYFARLDASTGPRVVRVVVLR